MDKPDRIYVVFIASSPQKVWQMLTDARSGPDWLFGYGMEVGARVGGPFRFVEPHGGLLVDGNLLVRQAPRRLRTTWVMPDMPVPPVENEVEFLIEEKEQGVVRMAVQEYYYSPVPKQWIESSRECWSLMLSGLKTLLETGKPLPRFKKGPLE